MLGSAALHIDDTPAAAGQFPVVLDIAGRRVDLDPREATRLRDAAAARAGRSSVARDLALLLDRGLSGRRVIALRRAESHTLAELAAAAGMSALAAEISVPAA